MTQHERVLDYLTGGKKLTCLNAFAELGITQVASRILELKREGYTILKNNIKVSNRYGETVTVAEYYMEEQK